MVLGFSKEERKAKRAERQADREAKAAAREARLEARRRGWKDKAKEEGYEEGRRGGGGILGAIGKAAGGSPRREVRYRYTGKGKNRRRHRVVTEKREGLLGAFEFGPREEDFARKQPSSAGDPFLNETAGVTGWGLGSEEKAGKKRKSPWDW